MNSPSKDSRIYSLDILKSMALIAVVYLHSASGYLYAFESLIPHKWWTANIIDSLTRWAVPVFIMVTGALLLGENKTSDIRFFLKRRMIRILLPFLFFSLIYSVFKIIDGQIIDNNSTIYDQLWTQFYDGNVYYHMWYIYMLLGLIFIIPLLDIFCSNASDNLLRYFLLIWCFSAFLTVFFSALNINRYLELGKYSGYIVLGYSIFKRKLFNWSLKTSLNIFILSSLAIVLGTYYFSAQKQSFDSRFYVYLSLPVVLQAISVFSGIINQDSSNKENRMVKSLSKYSLGIYLLHVLIMDVFAKGYLGFTISEYNFLSLTDNSLLCILFQSTNALLCSWLLIFLMDKIPYIRRLIN